jgi:ADP-heptose:LPS heptosyltransferase
VARELERHGHHVVVTGSDTDAHLARAVCVGAGLPLDRVLAGRTDVTGLAAVVAAARLVVSGDTGIAHLATAYGTPSVVLFGPISPALWGPPPDRPQHRALWTGPSRPTVDAIPVADVLAAALSPARQGVPGAP